MPKSYSFDKFSPETQAILLKSQELAETNGGLLGSEFLLIALLIVEQRSPAKELLAEYLVDIDQIQLVMNLEPPAVDRPSRDGLTDEARRVIEQSALQAIHTKATVVDPVHLLWAMVSDETTTAATILTKTGVNPSHLRSQLEQLFHEHAHLEHLIQEHLELFDFASDDGDGESAGPTTLPHPTKKRSAIDTLTTDLTALAEKLELDPMIGRTAELERVIHLLLRRTKNNPVLVGDPGVGKTSIVEGLAQRLAAGSVPPALRGVRLHRLEVASLVAGTMYRGQFEDRMRKLLTELEERPNVILFVDEVHTIIGAGSAEGSLDAANILKPALAKGSLRVIGATTLDEYQKHIEKDAAFERRFQPVIVREPSLPETIAMLRGLRPKLEAHHHIAIRDELLTLAVDLAARYIPSRKLPDKAIDVIDEAAASRQFVEVVAPAATPTNLRLVERQLKALSKEKEFEIRRQNFERAAFLRDKELKLKVKLARGTAPTAATSTGFAGQLEPEQVIATVARMSGVPLEQLSNDLMSSSAFAERLGTSIVGQSHALDRVARVLARARVGFRPAHQPQSALLFVGPSGVGKTALAYTVSRELFGSTDALIRLDMSEYREPHTVSRLVGAPPGYVGHDDAGKLTEQVRQRPASIILFDEIEKAHPDIFNLLLQILDYGTLTDSKGRAVNFRNAHIILTTNVGGDTWKTQKPGFDQSATSADRAREAIQGLFRTELINRLDDIVVFQPLSADSIATLVNRHLIELNERLTRHQLAIRIQPAAQRAFVDQTLASNLGARELERLLANELDTPAIELLLKPNRRTHDAELAWENGVFQFVRRRAAAATPKLALHHE